MVFDSSSGGELSGGDGDSAVTVGDRSVRFLGLPADCFVILISFG